MINTDKLNLVKSSTVALGLVNKGGMVPKAVCGSGFIINENYYMMTASHVIKKCLELKKHYDQKNLPTEIVAFRSSSTNEETLFQVLPLDLFSDHSIAFYSFSKMASGYAGPQDVDICIGKFIKKPDSFTFLEIKKPSKLNLYDEIAMCGYPNGDQTLDLEKRFMGIRFSPVMQFGRISGFMPTDNVPIPFGVQTDIVGTGGSSGSPLVDPNDGQVIGIAQQVVLAGVETNNKSVYGTAKIGLVLGITNNLFYELSERISKFLEDGTNITHDVQSTHFEKGELSYF